MSYLKIASLAFLFFVSASCKQAGQYDLVIKNASVFDSKTGKVSRNRTILIKGSIIENVTDSSGKYTAKNTIDAQGKLVTPGFIDTHTHPTDVFGDYDAAPEYLPSDSLGTLG